MKETQTIYFGRVDTVHVGMLDFDGERTRMRYLLTPNPDIPFGIAKTITIRVEDSIKCSQWQGWDVSTKRQARCRQNFPLNRGSLYVVDHRGSLRNVDEEAPIVCQYQTAHSLANRYRFAHVNPRPDETLPVTLVTTRHLTSFTTESVGHNSPVLLFCKTDGDIRRDDGCTLEISGATYIATRPAYPYFYDGQVRPWYSNAGGELMLAMNTNESTVSRAIDSTGDWVYKKPSL